MEFRLDPDQVDLQQTVSRFFEDRYPLDRVAEREGSPLDRDGWRAMADLGILGLLVEEGAGGSGLGVLEAALVFEQVGSHLVSGPLLWSVLAEPHLAGAIDGSVVVTGVDLTGIDLTGIDLTGEVDGVDRDGGEDGGGVLVEWAADADVVLAVRDGAVTAHPSTGLVDVEPRTSLDPLSAVSHVASLGPGTVVGDGSSARDLAVVGNVLAAAELVGVASRSLEVARAYALERHQFDVPIGSFQAVKHLLADMYVRTTLAQSATYAAAAVVDRPGGGGLGGGDLGASGDDASRSAAAAKLLAADAAIEGASTAIQVLGGMGFTWDMLPNHLLKRAWHVADRFGAAEAQAARLGADLVGSTR